MPSKSESDNWSSNSLKISFKHDVGMKPLPSLSYNLKASFNSFWTVNYFNELFESNVLKSKILTGFLIFFNDEFGSQNNEFFKFKTSWFVLIDFFNHLIQDLFIEGLSHQSENFSNSFCGNWAALLAIEAIESILQDYFWMENKENKLN